MAKAWAEQLPDYEAPTQDKSTCFRRDQIINLSNVSVTPRAMTDDAIQNVLEQSSIFPSQPVSCQGQKRTFSSAMEGTLLSMSSSAESFFSYYGACDPLPLE